MTVEATIGRLRTFASDRGWTKSRFAREAGLPDTTLRGFHEPHWNPTAETLRKLEAVIPPDWAAPVEDHRSGDDALGAPA